jgi:hypothetical protein
MGPIISRSFPLCMQCTQGLKLAQQYCSNAATHARNVGRACHLGSSECVVGPHFGLQSDGLRIMQFPSCITGSCVWCRNGRSPSTGTKVQLCGSRNGMSPSIGPNVLLCSSRNGRSPILLAERGQLGVLLISLTMRPWLGAFWTA